MSGQMEMMMQPQQQYAPTAPSYGAPATQYGTAQYTAPQTQQYSAVPQYAPGQMEMMMQQQQYAPTAASYGAGATQYGPAQYAAAPTTQQYSTAPQYTMSTTMGGGQQRYSSTTTYQPGAVQYGTASYGASQTSYGAPQVTTTYGPAQSTVQSSVTQSYQPVMQGGRPVVAGSTTPGMTSGKIENTYYGASRFVTGEERVIGYNTIQQEERVISERVVTHEVKVPKKVIREEVIEKVIIVPETVTREEVIEEVQTVRETIVEVAKPIVQEKIVEVPEIEYRDKIVEVVEKMVQTKVKEIPRIEYQERVVEVPKIIPQERIVEVPEVEYREILTEKIVEVPEIREQVVVKQVQAPPQYVEKPMPQYVNIDVPVDIHCNLPVPVEALTTFEYQLAQFRPRVNKVTYPLYVPRFVEVPVAAELFSAQTVQDMKASASRLQGLNMAQAVGLCEVENLATEFRGRDVTALQVSSDLRTALFNSITNGTAPTGVPGQPVYQQQSVAPTSYPVYSQGYPQQTYQQQQQQPIGSYSASALVR